MNLDYKYLEFLLDIIEEKRVVENKEVFVKQIRRLIHIEKIKERRKCIGLSVKDFENNS